MERSIRYFNVEKTMIAFLDLESFIDSEEWQVTDCNLFDSSLKKAKHPIRMKWSGNILLLESEDSIHVTFDNISSVAQLSQLVNACLKGIGYQDFYDKRF